jgi:hypothetical protein
VPSIWFEHFRFGLPKSQISRYDIDNADSSLQANFDAMETPDLDDFRWLLSDAAVPMLEIAQRQFVEHVNVVRIAKGLRKLTSATRSAIIMEQAQLRLRGRVKFSRAEEMFFTKRGLEQATSESISTYKARRFQRIQAVLDACCGVGGDLLGLIEREGGRRTLGIDADSVTTLFAAHNLSLHCPNSQSINEVEQRTFESIEIEDWEGIHCDPDRRMNERTVLGSRFSPPLQEVFARVCPEQHFAIKVAPATPESEGWPAEIEREWIGDRRECKQQVIWAGRSCIRVGGRTATVVDGSRVLQLQGDDESALQTVEIAREIKRYLYEPHATVLAAGLTNELASQCGIARMASDIDYLTSSARQQHPLMTTFEVIESFPLSLKKVIEFLQSRSIGQIEVKNRGGANLIYEKLVRLKLDGDCRAIVILTRIGLQQWIAICRRSPNDFPN